MRRSENIKYKDEKMRKGEDVKIRKYEDEKMGKGEDLRINKEILI
jgi:hypothetical protein